MKSVKNIFQDEQPERNSDKKVANKGERWEYLIVIGPK